MNRVTYDFTGNRYVVTGASSGMGRQVTLDLAEAGAVVLAIGRNAERLEELKSHNSSQIITSSLNVCDKNALEVSISNFVTNYGKLNGSVHAAGIIDITPLRVYDDERARIMMDTTFWAGINLVQLAVKAKYGERGSSHVLFSSVDAIAATKSKFAYAAAKAAVNSAVRSIAKEIASKQQRINSILPGWVSTPMTAFLEAKVGESDSFVTDELLGAGKPEDVSGAVLFLLSDKARWITGTNLVVDGGYLA
jgi:NAD(P)-dependent dehydrogenase (short-subunit alcohol dehydrogenase family)